MIHKLIQRLFCCGLVLFVNHALAHSPYCAKPISKPQVIAYLGADTQWRIQDGDVAKLNDQLDHVDVVNYAFIRFGKNEQGQYTLKPSSVDRENIAFLRSLKPNLPIILAIGGWGDRDGFTPLLENPKQFKAFVQSVKALLSEYDLDGIDVDWENEQLASSQEVVGLVKLFETLHQQLSQEGYCITSAVPASPAYWFNYPHAQDWHSYVNWTTVMAYDHYGTFGPRTEHAAALYEPERVNDDSYPYPSTSAHQAISHYIQQGLAAEKVILGVPFYCHSYYLDNQTLSYQAEHPGLHQTVLDPNISSQVSFEKAYNTFGKKLYQQKVTHTFKGYQASSYYGLLPLKNTQISQFMSCDNPQTIKEKVAYIKGANPLAHSTQKNVKLGGISFWSLQQDLPYPHEQSLLQAIQNSLVQE